jgi:hypothetical protein
LNWLVLITGCSYVKPPPQFAAAASLSEGRRWWSQSNQFQNQSKAARLGAPGGA